LSVSNRGDNGSRGIALNFNSLGNVILTAVMDVVTVRITNNQQTIDLNSGTFDFERFTFDANTNSDLSMRIIGE